MPSRKMLKADLHLHSTASDGVLSPTALVERAVALGFDVIALTDHDTVSGLCEANKAARGRIGFVYGVELSVQEPCELHILGLGINNVGLIRNRLDEALKKRHARNEKIIALLNENGVEITYGEVLAQARGESVGRAHIAAELVKNGVCCDMTDAFTRYLNKGGTAYVSVKRFTAEEAIALIHDAGGIAVFAHPFSTALACEGLDRLTGMLAAQGLDGIESHYFAHTIRKKGELSAIAAKYNLVRTGGSDFHSPEKNAEGSFSLSKKTYELIRNGR